MRDAIFWASVVVFLSVGWWMNTVISFSMGDGIQSLIGLIRVIGIIIPPLGGVLGYL